MKRIAAIAMLCLLAITAGCSKVPAGYTGVIVNLMGSDKGVAPTEATVGYKWLTPNEELFLFPTFAQNFNLQQVKFQDRDGMTISAPIGITLRAKQGAAPLLFQTYRKSMDEIIQVNVPQVVRNAFNNAGSKVKASEVYGPGKEAFLKAIEAQVQQHFESKGIVVESLYLNGEIVLPPQVVEALSHAQRLYGAAINAPLIAARLILERQQKLPEAFTAREVRQKDWTGLGSQDAVNNALAILVEHDFIVGYKVAGEKGGRPSTRYVWRKTLP